MATTRSAAMALPQPTGPDVVAWSGTQSAEPASPSVADLSKRFLTPDDRSWTDDGAGTWVIGHATGLTYAWVPGTRRIALRNQGRSDVAVLSMPRLTGTAGSSFTYLPSGSSEVLPDAEFHLLQSDRVDGRPVMIGQIAMNDGQPEFVLDGPDSGELDWSEVDPRGDYWKPGDADFATSTAPEFVFLEPLGRSVFHTVTNGEVAVHNRGDGPIAVLTIGTHGPLDMVEVGPGESAPVPAGDAVCYVQASRVDGAPALLGALWICGGVVMPSELPLPTQRDFLDFRYLTPSSPDNDSPYVQQIYLDAREENISYQFRSGASTMTVRNGSSSWIAVSHHVDGEPRLTEVMPGTAVALPVDANADRGQVFSVVGERVEAREGRPVSVAADGTLRPGRRPERGIPTNYGSVVIMLGSVVYSALPKKNLYLAWSDRWRRRRSA